MTKSEKVKWTVAAVLIMAVGVVGLVWISKRRKAAAGPPEGAAA